LEALRLVASYLDDRGLQASAAASAVRIACPQRARDKGLRGPEVGPILKKVIAVTRDGNLRKKAEAQLRRIPKGAKGPQGEVGAKGGEEGFVSLFNGKDMAGWVGAVKGYVAENGLLVCLKKGGGNLFTEKEYADFILRFEFKLTPGANNGLGIRTPLRGNPAYAGMELQILDNTAKRYAKLRPYQFHGSIYGVVPAKRGHLKPVGEWNAQEVTAKGTRITVKLNGATIVDADLAPFINGEKKTADGGGVKRHPGLLRKTGHIGFLGHGARIEFRNLRIKELQPGAGEM
ncbi:unnamed protein product, partial [marine sediment metagenome]